MPRLFGGAGAFVMTARDDRDFGPAIQRKLIREISAAPVAEIAPGKPRDGKRLADLAADRILER